MKKLSNLKKLEKLFLNRNYQIEDDLSETLQHLELTEISVLGCVRLTDKFLEKIPKTLTRLNISRNNVCNEETLINLFKRCQFLSVLEMTKIKAVTDNVLKSIGENLSNSLTVLHFSNEKITEECLVENVLKKCLSLKSLQVPFCSNLGFETLSNYQTNLENLTVTKNFSVNNDLFTKSTLFPNLLNLIEL